MRFNADVIAARTPFAILLNVSAVRPASHVVKNPLIPIPKFLPNSSQLKVVANLFKPVRTVFREFAIVLPKSEKSLAPSPPAKSPLRKDANPVPNPAAF